MTSPSYDLESYMAGLEEAKKIQCPFYCGQARTDYEATPETLQGGTWVHYGVGDRKRVVGCDAGKLWKVFPVKR